MEWAVSQLRNGDLVATNRFVPKARHTFNAAAEQATRYGRQVAALNIEPHTPRDQTYGDSLRVFNAWMAFISQFSGNVREVLTRTFWQAFYS